MNIYHLRYFVTLAYLEHYTKAAEKLSITQPTLSNAITMLENELGVKLFEKEGRNVILTKYGKIFLKDIEVVLNNLDLSVKKLKSIGSGDGTIELAFLRTLGKDFIPEVTSDFIESNPDKSISFDFHTGVTSSIVKGLKEKEFDVAFCSKMENEKDIEFVPVSKQDLVLIVPNGHPLSTKNEIDLRDTLKYKHIIFTKSSGLRYIIDDMFKKINKTPEIAYEIEEDQVIAGLVSKNFGIAVVPYMDSLKYTDVKVINIVYPTWERNFYIAYLKNSYLSPLVLNFINFAIKRAEI